jgi:surfactin synthase thioesterase subunit
MADLVGAMQAFEAAVSTAQRAYQTQFLAASAQIETATLQLSQALQQAEATFIQAIGSPPPPS